MELPFYLKARGSAGSSWIGSVSLEGEELHFELRSEDERSAGATVFDVPLREVDGAEFQRGLVSRSIAIKLGSAAARERFPAGVSGNEVHLMVAKQEPDFGERDDEEAKYEELVGQIEELTGAPSTNGLVS